MENKNFENLKIAIKNKKIDFDKNKILTPIVVAKSEKMITFSLQSVE